MPIRRRAWLTREGWYYLAVLAFIVAGAVFKGVNLLVVLAGMMFAPLIVNWRVVMASLVGLTVRRKLPDQICAGEPLSVELTVENPRRWMSSWMLTIEDWIEQVEGREEGDGRKGTGDRGQRTARRQATGNASSWRQGVRALWRRWRGPATRGEAVIAHVPTQGRAGSAYRLILHRRGRYRFGPLRISTRFPLGLVWGWYIQPARAELIVAPRIGQLSPDWAHLIEAQHVGDAHRHPQRGVVEGDYYGIRPWQSGDSMRWVHWRTTAKMGRPMVRQFERRRNRDVALLLDPWLPADAHERDEGLLELALSLAATALADLTSRGHSHLTFAIAGDQQQCWSGPASPLFCQELLARLADTNPSRRHSLTQALEGVIDAAPSGARLVIISPRDPGLAGTAADPIDLPLDPEDLCWIDVSSSRLESLFSLE